MIPTKREEETKRLIINTILEEIDNPENKSSEEHYSACLKRTLNSTDYLSEPEFRKIYVEEFRKIETKKFKGKISLQLPNQGKMISDFAGEVSDVLVKSNANLFYRPQEKALVEIDRIEESGIDGNKNVFVGFTNVLPTRFINIMERYVETFTVQKTIRGPMAVIKSIPTDQAKVMLSSDVWQDKLKKIERIFTAQIPLLRGDKLLFPDKGHDPRFNSWTIPEAPDFRTDMNIEEAKQILYNIYGEFCFKNKQSTTNAISQLLTEYCQGLYPKFNTRTPVFFWEANRERAGKDYGAVVPALVLEGEQLQDAPIATKDKHTNGTEEFRKKLLSMLRSGRRRFHSTNNSGNIRNEVFEGAVIAEYWSDRMLGQNAELKFPNEIFYSMSANVGYTASPDFVNRCRFVRLHLDIEDANARFFKLDMHTWIRQNRGLVLSACYALVREWNKAGMPLGTTPFTSFPIWAKIVGGIMVHNGLGDPCGRDDDLIIHADRETEDMKTFFEIMYEKHPDSWLTKQAMLGFLRDKDYEDLHELFPGLDPQERAGQTRFAFILNKYVGRIFSDVLLVLDNSNGRTSRHTYKFTKQKEIKEESIMPFKLGNVGNLGNVWPTPPCSAYVSLHTAVGETLPMLPGLPEKNPGILGEYTKKDISSNLIDIGGIVDPVSVIDAKNAIKSDPQLNEWQKQAALNQLRTDKQIENEQYQKAKNERIAATAKLGLPELMKAFGKRKEMEHEILEIVIPKDYIAACILHGDLMVVKPGIYQLAGRTGE